MDRGKSVQGRGGKSKTPQYPADIFALGSKASSEGKRSSTIVHGKAGTSGHSIPDRKREGVNAPIIQSKKSKVSSSVIAPSSSTSRSGTNSADAWELLAIDVEPPDLVPFVLEANDLDEADKVLGLLCGAIRALRSQKLKPDAVLTLGLCYLAKIRPSLFSNDCVVSALCSLLRKEPAHAFKARAASICVLAACILAKAFRDVKRWPESFVKLYVEDAVGERLWVDYEYCKCIGDNILNSINMKKSPTLEPESQSRSDPTSVDEECLLPTLSLNKQSDFPVYSSEFPTWGTQRPVRSSLKINSNGRLPKPGDRGNWIAEPFSEENFQIASKSIWEKEN